ncbi:hypothetical protein [Clostridium ljungdahlii]|uniref:Uncharacterized protein n=1 Tax=Clostridium ljungdahlii (strain ATCC 55383 / DSM 13528 / PETC) TaxID=748727 RepID=D8GMF7_CLOLD|nr:hypothetical protein [Clostridium ljungdahlii]ADK13567.1 hypothetical protein CLJU_c04850 [Clostridium ljungdahlii DSM 13528]OAA89184.1 hypothetical protein WX45_02426 [Clostridium ljungdahlii DSM 13528]
MKNYINILSLNNEVNRNRVSNAVSKSNGESFANIFNRAIKCNTCSSNICSVEELNESLKEDLDKRVDVAVERLAGFFGIGKHLMAAILKYLHIDPKDLLDPARKQDIVDTLSKQFGLNKHKSDALYNLISDLGISACRQAG